MASSFGSSSILVISLALVSLFFVAPSFAEKHTNLKKLCSRSTNSAWCMELMKDDSRTSHADSRDLIEIAIDLAYEKANGIHRDLNSVYGSTRNSKLKARYSSCSKNYHDAMRDLELTRELFRRGDFKRIRVQVNDAVEEINDCKREFEKPPTDSIRLKKRTKEFELLCDVVRISSSYA